MTSPRTTTRVLLASPGGLAALGLRQMMKRIPQMSIVAEISSHHALGASLRRYRPDLLIIDASILAAYSCDASDFSSIRVLLLSSRPYCGALPEDVMVCGCISERDCLEKVDAVLKTVAGCTGLAAHRQCSAHCPVACEFTPLQTLPLSLRERQVLALLGKGMGTVEIAQALSRSVKTIEAHRENIKRKLELDNAFELLDAARRWLHGEAIGLQPDASNA